MSKSRTLWGHVRSYYEAFLRRRWEKQGLLSPESPRTRELGEEFRRRIERGEELFLLGWLSHGHNSGAALVKVSRKDGIQALLNNEEERFIGKKHFIGHPEQSLKALGEYLKSKGLSPQDIFCVTWPGDLFMFRRLITQVLEISRFKLLTIGLKKIATLLFFLFRYGRLPNFYVLEGMIISMKEPLRLARTLGFSPPQPVIGLDHHGSHAFFSYGVSPFAHESPNDPVMISAIDGMGNSGPTSLYVVRNGNIECIKREVSLKSSLGTFYQLFGTFLGGWAPLSCEGRYMGAVAWGDADRTTNQYYKRLRQMLILGAEGSVRMSDRYVNFDLNILRSHPFKQELIDIVGPSIPYEKIWNPDAVLSVDDIEHSEITQERVNIAAAVQLIFEDALFHIIDYMIQTTRSDRLVLTGGSALNCVANMHLLEVFDERYYERYLGKKTRLQIWVPPVPSDQGTVIGAAYQFAMLNGAKPSGILPSAYLCGTPAPSQEILQAVAASGLKHRPLGDINSKEGLEQVSDFMAQAISKDEILGIFQGAAETGPRALGNRSFLANPCNPETLERLNSRIKYREKIRPLAPMVTLESAHEFYDLSDGAKAGNYDAYNYMVLTVRCKAHAKKVIPAVIHADGTSRIQIVRQENNPLIYAYLKAMKKHCGVEVSVNTSLNVGGPIVQSPEQALQIFTKAKGLSGMVMVGATGEAFLVWPEGSTLQPPS